MAIEIVDFPIQNGGSFHIYVNVYQRVYQPTISQGPSFPVLGRAPESASRHRLPMIGASSSPWFRTHSHFRLVNWLVVDLPLWKIWVRQLGCLFPYIMENKKCSKPPTSKSHEWLTSSEIVMSALKNYHFLFGNLMPSGLNHLQSPCLPHFSQHSDRFTSNLRICHGFSQPFPKLPLGSPHRSPFQWRQHRAAHALEAEPDLQQFPQREERRPGRAGHWDSLEHAWRTREKPKRP